MASGAVAGAAGATSQTSAAAGMNPFWSASNWYFEPNSNAILGGSAQLTTAAQPFSIQLNSNGFMKDWRVIVRSAGAIGGVSTPDSPWNLFQNLTFENPNGSQFFQDHTGYHHFLYQAYGRPWEGNPTNWFDFAQSINPSFTLKLAPEIRYTAGALPNMDSRRQYKVQGYVAPVATISSGVINTAPTISFASGIDTWAQPDSKDLMQRVNETIPPGQALQVYRRHSVQTLNGASSQNTIDGRALTGNLQRLTMLVVRDNNAARQDYLTDPITWILDTRTLANFTQADLFGWMNDFYGNPGTVLPRPTGVYVFPRYFNPGTLVGQGWLETSGATKLQWLSTTLSTAVNVPGTVDIMVEDCVPLTGLPYELTNI
jgi:hypothetical protein